MVTKALEVRAHGKDLDEDYTLGAEQRWRMDEVIASKFKFIWLCQYLAHNASIGKLQRMLRTRTDLMPNFNSDVKTFHKKGIDNQTDKRMLVELYKGQLTAKPMAARDSVRGFTKMH